MTRKIIVYVDGAASGNPGPGGWGALIQADNEVTELGGSENGVTNNQMELRATLAALEFLRGKPGHICMYSDSAYVIQGMTSWHQNWEARGWRTVDDQPLANSELWKAIVFEARERSEPIQWNHVPGHAGIPGNDRADEIAVAYSRGANPKLHRLASDVYPYKLEMPVPDARKLSDKKRKKAPAYSYLSLVNGRVERHSDWETCENRVRGVSGAKFQKTLNAKDEEEILKSWGVPLKKVF